MMNLARIAAPLIAIGAIAGYAGYKCGDEPATTPTTAVSTYGERVGVGAQRREAPAERPQSTAEERSAIRNETKVADEHQLELLNEPLLMKKLRELAEADPELSIRLARAGNERFPDSDDAPERTWFLVKNLVNLRRFHEARAEAQLMAERHPRSSWTDDVVRHLLVYPLDQPSREEMQRKAAGQ